MSKQAISAENKTLRKMNQQLLKALRGVTRDMELCARNGYYMPGCKFDDCFKASDPQGYKLWKSARKAIDSAAA